MASPSKAALGSRITSGCTEIGSARYVIPVDDAYVVARLLGAGEALHQARLRSIREGWAARFDAIYGPVKTIIEQEILPLVSSAVREKATLLVDVKRLPLIE